VPLGAYVVVAEPGGCIVTEGGGYSLRSSTSYPRDLAWKLSPLESSRGWCAD
jgi:hypothetical protein